MNTANLANRWLHVKAVAQRAEEVAGTVEPADRCLLVAAAWLHDIGYAPDLVETGMHSLDGARYLRRLGYPLRLAALVAHHSGARFEAIERGLTRAIVEFPDEGGLVAEALATADLTTGPRGQRMTFEARMAEILGRYPEDSTVHQAMRRARPALAAYVQRTIERLSADQS